MSGNETNLISSVLNTYNDGASSRRPDAVSINPSNADPLIAAADTEDLLSSPARTRLTEQESLSVNYNPASSSLLNEMVRWKQLQDSPVPEGLQNLETTALTSSSRRSQPSFEIEDEENARATEEPHSSPLYDDMVVSKKLQHGLVPVALQSTMASTPGVSQRNAQATVNTSPSPPVPNNDLICSKLLQDGLVPPALQRFPAPIEDVDTDTREPSNIERLSVPSCPPRPLAVPTSVENSVRRHYVSSRLRATASRLVSSTTTLSPIQRNNVTTVPNSEQPEHLAVAFPVDDIGEAVILNEFDAFGNEQFKKRNQIQSRRIRQFACLTAFLILSAVALVAGIIYVENDRHTQDQHDLEQQTEETQLLKSILGADAVLLENNSSSYSQAYEWLLQHNESGEPWHLQKNFVQRFLAVSFYYSTTTVDDKWTSCNPPEGRDQTCFNPETAGSSFSIYLQPVEQSWLSSSHECEWAGVWCDNSQQIIGLKLDNMNLVGSFPDMIFSFPFLQTLSLRHSRLDGRFQLSFDVQHLVSLSLRNNSITGNLSSSFIWQSRKLKIFDVGDNGLTGSLSPQIGNLVEMKILYLYNNQLTGMIPTEIGWLDSIHTINVYNNALQGELPLSMRLWNDINDMRMGNNNFSGSIPTFLASLNSTLIELRLQNNSFVGTLPDELFNLGILRALDLSNNELTGTLDERVALFSNSMYSLRFAENRFFGIVPTELGLLTDLLYLHLNGNDFIESVPASVCKIRNWFSDEVELYAELFADCASNNDGSVELKCGCCTSCCQGDGTHCQ